MQILLKYIILLVILDCFMSFYIQNSKYLRMNRINKQMTNLKNIKIDEQLMDKNYNNIDKNNSNNNNNNVRNEVNKYSPEIIAILLIYFIQGAIGISRLAVSYFMKDTLLLSPSDMAAITGITTLPWIIKPLYGFLSDSLPIFGYRRRSYLIISGILGGLSWIYLGSLAHDPLSTIISTTIGSLSIAISDVVADSLVVEKSRDFKSNTDVVDTKTSGDLQSLCWIASAIGGIISAYYSGTVLKYFSISNIFYITSIFPFLLFIISFFINEKLQINSVTNISSITTSESLSQSFISQFNQIKQILTQKSIYLPILFIFLYQATPNIGSTMFYYYTNTLHFSSDILGNIQFYSTIASFLGIVCYRLWFRNVSIQQLLKYVIYLSIPLSLLQVLLTTRYNINIGIPDDLFVLSDSIVLTVLNQIAFMPILVLASSLCPVGIEGTLFSTLMSIFNFGGIVSTEIGGWLTSVFNVNEYNYDNLTLLIVIISITNLLPLLLLKYIPDGVIEEDK